MADKMERLARIRAAKATLDAEAKLDPADLDPGGPGPSSGMQERGRRKRAKNGGPPDKAPSRRILMDRGAQARSRRAIRSPQGGA